MGDGLIPDPLKVIYEDDDMRVSLIDPSKYMTRESVESIEITPANRAQWAGVREKPALQQEVSVTLTAHQWAGVLAMLRISMGITPQPGVVRLMHDDIMGQLPIRKRADGA